MKTEFKYKVGEKVLLNCKESVIEQTGISLNHLRIKNAVRQLKIIHKKIEKINDEQKFRN